MPIRIYALAKDLDIDSKELVDLCKKAGIHNKGSALASLDDDEVTKVKAFLSDRSGPAEPKAAAPAADNAPVRPSKVADRKLKTIVSPKRRDEPEEPAETQDESPADEPVVVAEQQDTTPAPPAEESESEAPLAPAEEVAEDEDPKAPAGPAPMRRGDYRAPGNKGIRVLSKGGGKADGKGGDAKASDPKADDAPRPKKRREPVINIKLGKMPEVKQPTGKPKANEPKAQKPVIRLPKDALSTGDKSKGPLKKQLAEVEAKQRRGGSGGPKAPVEPPPAPGEAPLSGKRRRGGKSGGSEEAAPKEGRLAGMANTRANRQQTRRNRSKPNLRRDDDRGYRRGRGIRRTGKNTAAPRKGNVVVELPCTVRTFSEATGVGAGKVLGVLMRGGIEGGLSINAGIPDELVEELALELGLEVDIRHQESLEDELLNSIDITEDDEDALTPRPPIITFLGHVDHGKTSLLDRIIGLDVVSGEAGGITQHIRAYKVKDAEGRDIAFVDTPGHEAFTEMRARGANVTDIAVLVVAADDGIMPQTQEAISHAKAAEVPIVVALNKVDLPGVDINRVMTQMTEYDLTPSEWGGDVEVVQTSAITGQGVDDLLETLQSIAELHELKANPDRDAYGVCLEAEQEGGRGVIAKVVVQSGTLKVGDVVVCGTSHGRVKAMYDTLKRTKRLKKAGPSTPVNITGFDTAPGAGEKLYVVEDIAKAREIAEQRAHKEREKDLAGVVNAVDYANFMRLLEEGQLGKPDERVTLNLIIRADVKGSIEAIQKELGKLEHPEVQIKLLFTGVGAVTLGDVTLADASQAVIIAFNVIPDESARQLADERSIEIRRYDVIYKVTDDIKAMLEGRLRPEERVVELGRALVKQVFPISRVGAVAGCYVAQGAIERGCRIRVFRDGRAIGDYELDSLRREKEDIKSVPRGMECGIKLSGFNDIKQNDVLEAYKIEEVARTL